MRLVIGCNYHTTWQKNKAMRFILVDVQGAKARLKTRTTNKNFWTDTKDLIFIETSHNRDKADGLEKEHHAGKANLRFRKIVDLLLNGETNV